MVFDQFKKIYQTFLNIQKETITNSTNTIAFLPNRVLRHLSAFSEGFLILSKPIPRRRYGIETSKRPLWLKAAENWRFNK